MSKSWRCLTVIGCFLILLFGTGVRQGLAQSFEVASVRLAPADADPLKGSWTLPGTGRFTATNMTLTGLIQLAYDVDGSQITHKPTWLDSTLYNIDAKPEEGVRLTRAELRPLLQHLLSQRFRLVVHTEEHSVAGYALIASKQGSHLTPTQHADFPGDFLNISAGQMRGYHWSVAQLAKYLTKPAGLPVTDQSGIYGTFDVSFAYNPNPDVDSAAPTLNEALRGATGLELKRSTITVNTIAIASVDKVPSAN